MNDTRYSGSNKMKHVILALVCLITHTYFNHAMTSNNPVLTSYSFEMPNTTTNADTVRSLIISRELQTFLTKLASFFIDVVCFQYFY